MILDYKLDKKKQFNFFSKSFFDAKISRKYLWENDFVI